MGSLAHIRNERVGVFLDPAFVHGRFVQDNGQYDHDPLGVVAMAQIVEDRRKLVQGICERFGIMISCKGYREIVNLPAVEMYRELPDAVRSLQFLPYSREDVAEIVWRFWSVDMQDQASDSIEVHEV